MERFQASYVEGVKDASGTDEVNRMEGYLEYVGSAGPTRPISKEGTATGKTRNT